MVAETLMHAWHYKLGLLPQVLSIDAVGTFAMCRAGFEALSSSHGTVINISATLHCACLGLDV
jgi:hypothetical protein